MSETPRRDFATMLARTPGFEVPIAPECNIVCFRYGDDDEHQERIRRAILERGDFYIVKTKLRGKTYLRATIINPRTVRSDLERLIAQIELKPSFMTLRSLALISRPICFS